jgi:hypothetical protein
MGGTDFSQALSRGVDGTLTKGADWKNRSLKNPFPDIPNIRIVFTISGVVVFETAVIFARAL